MAKFGKAPSSAQLHFAQYIRALQYNGPVFIKDKLVQKFSNGFFVELSTKPTQLSRTYRVLIVCIYSYQPFCYVLSPNLIEIADREDKVPHMYSQDNKHLCLTYPKFHEWTSDMLIMDTYMPWIELWLFNYEQWLLTNVWEGGGVHPGDDAIAMFENNKPKTSGNSRKKSQNSKKRSATDIANDIYKKRSFLYLEKQKENELG